MSAFPGTVGVWACDSALQHGCGSPEHPWDKTRPHMCEQVWIVLEQSPQPRIIHKSKNVQ